MSTLATLPPPTRRPIPAEVNNLLSAWGLTFGLTAFVLLAIAPLLPTPITDAEGVTTLGWTMLGSAAGALVVLGTIVLGGVRKGRRGALRLLKLGSLAGMIADLLIFAGLLGLVFTSSKKILGPDDIMLFRIMVCILIFGIPLVPALFGFLSFRWAGLEEVEEFVSQMEEKPEETVAEVEGEEGETISEAPIGTEVAEAAEAAEEGVTVAEEPEVSAEAAEAAEAAFMEEVAEGKTVDEIEAEAGMEVEEEAAVAPEEEALEPVVIEEEPTVVVEPEEGVEAEAAATEAAEETLAVEGEGAAVEEAEEAPAKKKKEKKAKPRGKAKLPLKKILVPVGAVALIGVVAAGIYFLLPTVGMAEASGSPSLFGWMTVGGGATLAGLLIGLPLWLASRRKEAAVAAAAPISEPAEKELAAEPVAEEVPEEVELTEAAEAESALAVEPSEETALEEIAGEETVASPEEEAEAPAADEMAATESLATLADEEAAASGEEAVGIVEEEVAEPEAEPAAKKKPAKGPGLFAKLFGRKRKPAKAVEQAIVEEPELGEEAAVAETPEALVDEEAPTVSDEAVGIVEEQVAEPEVEPRKKRAKGPGLFAKLFGRKRKPAKAVEQAIVEEPEAVEEPVAEAEVGEIGEEAPAESLEAITGEEAEPVAEEEVGIFGEEVVPEAGIAEAPEVGEEEAPVAEEGVSILGEELSVEPGIEEAPEVGGEEATVAGEGVDILGEKISAEAGIVEAPEEAAHEAEAEAAPKKEKRVKEPGLFARLFGRKPKPKAEAAALEELAVAEPLAEEPMAEAAVEEAVAEAAPWDADEATVIEESAESAAEEGLAVAEPIEEMMPAETLGEAPPEAIDEIFGGTAAEAPAIQESPPIEFADEALAEAAPLTDEVKEADIAAAIDDILSAPVEEPVAEKAEPVEFADEAAAAAQAEPLAREIEAAEPVPSLEELAGFADEGKVIAEAEGETSEAPAILEDLTAAVAKEPTVEEAATIEFTDEPAELAEAMPIESGAGERAEILELEAETITAGEPADLDETAFLTEPTPLEEVKPEEEAPPKVKRKGLFGRIISAFSSKAGSKKGVEAALPIESAAIEEEPAEAAVIEQDLTAADIGEIAEAAPIFTADEPAEIAAEEEEAIEAIAIEHEELDVSEAAPIFETAAPAETVEDEEPIEAIAVEDADMATLTEADAVDEGRPWEAAVIEERAAAEAPEAAPPLRYERSSLVEFAIESDDEIASEATPPAAADSIPPSAESVHPAFEERPAEPPLEESSNTWARVEDVFPDIATESKPPSAVGARPAAEETPAAAELAPAEESPDTWAKVEEVFPDLDAIEKELSQKAAEQEDEFPDVSTLGDIDVTLPGKPPPKPAKAGQETTLLPRQHPDHSFLDFVLEDEEQEKKDEK